MKSLLSKFSTDSRGATAIEYALIAGIVSIGILATLTEIGPLVSANYGEVQAGFESVQ